MANNKFPWHKYFRKQDVNVRFGGPEGLIEVSRLDMPQDASMPAGTTGFQPLLPLQGINLKIIDTTKPNIKVLGLDPHIEVRVRYTPDIQAMLAAGGKPCLGYRDGTMWKYFTGVNQFHLEPPGRKTGIGLGVATIAQWTDPPIVWGK
jgi:hypothetical protein